ncbi:MAG: DUF6156 family protein, partial [Cellvibrionaceae bacterium]|nr:DUF6156 family protein [Cellvibrionaceae bacterium]
FVGYTIPLGLAGEITKAEAEKRRTFYVGYFDGGNLIRVEKYLNGDVFFTHDYEYYDDSSLRKSTVKNGDGDVTVNLFNEGELPGGS